jgi:hypothetical protein
MFWTECVRKTYLFRRGRTYESWRAESIRSHHDDIFSNSIETLIKLDRHTVEYPLYNILSTHCSKATTAQYIVTSLLS